MASSRTAACRAFWCMAVRRCAPSACCRHWRSTLAGPIRCGAVSLRPRHWQCRQSHDCPNTQHRHARCDICGSTPQSVSNTSSCRQISRNGYIVRLSDLIEDKSCQKSGFGYSLLRREDKEHKGCSLLYCVKLCETLTLACYPVGSR